HFNSPVVSALDPQFCHRTDPLGGAIRRKPVVCAGRSNHNPYASVRGRYSAVGVWHTGSHPRPSTFTACWVAQVVRRRFLSFWQETRKGGALGMTIIPIESWEARKIFASCRLLLPCKSYSRRPQR